MIASDGQPLVFERDGEQRVQTVRDWSGRDIRIGYAVSGALASIRSAAERKISPNICIFQGPPYCWPCAGTTGFFTPTSVTATKPSALIKLNPQKAFLVLRLFCLESFIF
jgi:hypothetical protein